VIPHKNSKSWMNKMIYNKSKEQSKTKKLG
jgi:hypothetical protein